MPIRKANSITERLGVNFVRGVVELNNSIFKEIDQRHDYGHDAFVLLVEGEHVIPKEVALQIKSGTSYCTPTECKIAASAGHLAFWAEHDLETLGVVFDPSKNSAYWIDLKAEARAQLVGTSRVGATIRYPKSAWNRFDAHLFSAFLVPALQGKVPNIGLSTSIEWAKSDDLDTHDVGVKILAARHPSELRTWYTILELFRERDPARLTPRAWIALVKIVGHHDDGGTHKVPQIIKQSVLSEVLCFGPNELTRLLFHVDESGFDRPSNGYSLMALIGARAVSQEIIATIRDSEELDQDIREKAALLLAMQEHDPRWFGWWRKEN